MATLSYSTTPHQHHHHHHHNHHHCYNSPSSLSLAFLSPPPSSSSSPLKLSSNSKKPVGPTSSFVPRFSTAAEVTEPQVVELESSAVVEADPVAKISKKEPVPEIFAVVMTGGRQYIVIPGRFLYIQRLKGANVNDKVILNKVLLVGTKTCTYVGKPIVHNAAVHAVVEEQGLDPKVIVYKYKKKKNYRRNIGHRQPNTRIRILGITGYENYPASTLPEGFVSQD